MGRQLFFDLIQTLFAEEHFALPLGTNKHRRNSECTALDRVFGVLDQSLLHFVCLAALEQVLRIETSRSNCSTQCCLIEYVDTIFPDGGQHRFNELDPATILISGVKHTLQRDRVERKLWVQLILGEAMFLDEARLAARVTHPNVVNASDINDLPENGLYVEGSVITRLMMGISGLQPVRANRVLAVRGQVVPVAGEALNLNAELADGSHLQGQSRIARSRGIRRVWLSPASESYRRYFAHRVAEMIRRAELQGLYFDFGTALPDSNPYHGADGGYPMLALRDFYRRLLNFVIESEALMGGYEDLHYFNKDHTPTYDHRVYSFARWSEGERLVILSNFDSVQSYEFELKVPEGLIKTWGLEEGDHPMEEMLYGEQNPVLRVSEGRGHIPLQVKPLESLILKLK